MAGGRTLRQVTDTHKKAQIVVAQATGVGEMELVQRLLDGELSADEFIAQSVELNKIGHEQAVRLAEQYVRQAREMMAPRIAPLPTVGVPFDYKNSLARAVSTVKAVERARQEAVRRAEAGLLGGDAGEVEKARQMLTEPGLTKAQASRLKHTLRQWTAASVQNAHRDTVIRSAQAVESGWRVVTDGNPCSFCAMLASYGEDVKGARAWPSHYFHPDCGCTIQEVPFGVDVEWTDRELELIHLREEAEKYVGTSDRKGMIAYMRAHGQGVVHDATIPEDERKKAGRPKKKNTSSSSGKKQPKNTKITAPEGGWPAGRGGADEKKWAQRQAALLSDTSGEFLATHEIEFLERFEALGEKVTWIPRAKYVRNEGRKSTNDFFWDTRNKVAVEMKATKSKYSTIASAISDAVESARAHDVVKDIFIVDLGEKTLSSKLIDQLEKYNLRRPDKNIKELWIMSENGGSFLQVNLREERGS